MSSVSSDTLNYTLGQAPDFSTSVSVIGRKIIFFIDISCAVNLEFIRGNVRHRPWPHQYLYCLDDEILIISHDLDGEKKEKVSAYGEFTVG